MRMNTMPRLHAEGGHGPGDLCLRALIVLAAERMLELLGT